MAVIEMTWQIWLGIFTAIQPPVFLPQAVSHVAILQSQRRGVYGISRPRGGPSPSHLIKLMTGFMAYPAQGPVSFLPSSMAYLSRDSVTTHSAKTRARCGACIRHRV